MNNLTGRSQHSPRHCPVLADAIASQLVRNGKYEAVDHKSSNYRPISLLSSFSKLLEKLMYKRLYNFLKCYKILNAEQFGFRLGHATSHATTLVISNIADAFEKKLLTIGVFLDLSKAFDTIDHDILLYKLNYYGIRGTACEWFKSYLSGRTQQVQFNNCLSSTIKPITSSVPQGLILVLFYMYLYFMLTILKTAWISAQMYRLLMILTSLLLVKIYNQSIQKLILNLKNIDEWIVATDDAPSCEVPSRRRTIKPPAWQKDYYMF